MTEPLDYGLLMLVLGSLALLSLPLRQGWHHACLLGLFGFWALGMALSVIGRWSGVLSPAMIDQIEFLAQLGIVAPLFRVGLESDPERLATELARATVGRNKRSARRYDDKH